MDARYLACELQWALGQPVFLDSSALKSITSHLASAMASAAHV